MLDMGLYQISKADLIIHALICNLNILLDFNEVNSTAVVAKNGSSVQNQWKAY